MLYNNNQLVSFLLFTYNQEKYVEKAIEGALEQSYSPLEIIISDDCSIDGTYKIIENTVRKYNGPHKVIINRNEKNLGIAEHVNKVFEMAKGYFFVLAAGDDISLSGRTQFLHDIFQSNESIMAVCSGYEKIDKNNLPLGIRITSQTGLDDNSALKRIKNNIWFGSTAAIKASVYDFFGDFQFKCADDRPYYRRACMLGNIYRTNKILVKYRIGGISNDTFNAAKSMLMNDMQIAGYKQCKHDLNKILLFKAEKVKIKILLFKLLILAYIKRSFLLIIKKCGKWYGK